MHFVMDNRLNEPFGARCFLTLLQPRRRYYRWLRVLMHLLALDAFWPMTSTSLSRALRIVLMYLLALILEGCWKMSHAIRLPLLQDLKLRR